MKKEIIENNILLAEFMGAQYIVPKNTIYPPYYRLFHPNGYAIKDVAPDKLLYHHSWNWLMPVVIKIEQGMEVTITSHSCLISNPGLYHVEFVSEKSKIHAVWNACVDFVKWHNAQSK